MSMDGKGYWEVRERRGSASVLGGVGERWGLIMKEVLLLHDFCVFIVVGERAAWVENLQYKCFIDAGRFIECCVL